MQKIMWKRAEYNASLPPYRFAPGDVVEIDDDWADQLVRKGIARKAPKNAMTVNERRALERDDTEERMAVQARSDRRAQLEAELAALDREDDTAGDYGEPGHYGDIVSRGDVEGHDDESKPEAKPADAKKSAR